MPKRLLSSSVLKWPSKERVLSDLNKWMKEVTKENPLILKIGYFGSCKEGNFGVGSDLDLVIIIKKTDTPFIYRAKNFDTSSFCVDVDLLVYTPEEWQKLKSSFKNRVEWIFERSSFSNKI